ncbi:MAG TPA: CcmD family protein [Bacillota bacterium]
MLYLFLGYAVVFILVLLFVVRLVGLLGRVEREVDRLRSLAHNERGYGSDGGKDA